MTSPPPDEVQLETPPATAVNSTTNRSALSRLRSASGTSTRPHASGSAGHRAGRVSRDEEETPVAISTNSLPVVLAVRLSPGGLKVQEEYDGNEPHWSVNEPCEPPSGVIASW